MNKLILQKKKGFSTLFVVIILGSLALTLTLTLSTSSLWSIRGGMDSKKTGIAKSLVNACAEVALEIIRENNSYTGNGSVMLNSETCSYSVINTGGSSRVIAASSTVSNITRKLLITTSSFNPLSISSWQEVQ